MTTPHPTPDEILALPLDLPYEDPTTVRGYLQDLLTTLWTEGSNFSAKRPLGREDWQWCIYTVLVAHGFVPGRLDKDGYLDDFTPKHARQADTLITEAIAHLFMTSL